MRIDCEPRLRLLRLAVLLKRYVEEQGAAQAATLLGRHQVLTSALAALEIKSAISRRTAAGELTAAHARGILARVAMDRTHWELVAVVPEVLSRAEEMVMNTRLRSADAVHVASAAHVLATSRLRFPFVTADLHQRHAAEALLPSVIWVG